MSDVSDSFFLDDCVNGIYIPDVLLVKGKIGISLVLGNIFVVSCLEAIKSYDFVSESKQFLDNITANKSCTSCHQYYHT